MEKNLEKLVPEYNSKNYFVRKYFFDRINYSIKLADIKPYYKICDIGCGNAILIKNILNSVEGVVKCFGVDINVKIKELSLPNTSFEVVDIEKERLPFESNFFDVIFAIDVLEHLRDLKNAIDEIYRVLKQFGTFIICGPTESYFYKFCRFLLKGTFSSKEGPASGEHYWKIKEIDKYIVEINKFKREKVIFLPKIFPKFLAGVWIIKYKKI